MEQLNALSAEQKWCCQFSRLILARFTTCTYNVDRQLDRARYLSRARFIGKIDHVSDRQKLRTAAVRWLLLLA
jgi:hypothetical protein